MVHGKAADALLTLLLEDGLVGPVGHVALVVDDVQQFFVERVFNHTVASLDRVRKVKVLGVEADRLLVCTNYAVFCLFA